MPDQADEFFASLIPGVQMFCPTCDRVTKWIRLRCDVVYSPQHYTHSSMLICTVHESLDGHDVLGIPELRYEIDMSYGDS